VGAGGRARQWEITSSRNNTFHESTTLLTRAATWYLNIHFPMSKMKWLLK
jgi:hypothetical protein